jgi:hypothetical protein
MAVFVDIRPNSPKLYVIEIESKKKTTLSYRPRPDSPKLYVIGLERKKKHFLII